MTPEAQAPVHGGVPRMAVVIPIFKQPALAVEAIESVLAQKTALAVMQGGAGDTLDLTALNDVMHPPALTVESIARHYSWADVMLLPSKFEGVPLSILEAQQFGCAVLATKVGAIPEIVEDGRTGFLFPNELDEPALVGMMLERLIELQANRDRLLEVARAAAGRGLEKTWAAAFAPFAEFIETLVRNG